MFGEDDLPQLMEPEEQPEAVVQELNTEPALPQAFSSIQEPHSSQAEVEKEQNSPEPNFFQNNNIDYSTSRADGNDHSTVQNDVENVTAEVNTNVSGDIKKDYEVSNEVE